MVMPMRHCMVCAIYERWFDHFSETIRGKEKADVPHFGNGSSSGKSGMPYQDIFIKRLGVDMP